MKLRAFIKDRETDSIEDVIIVQFEDEDGEKYFIKEVDKFEQRMFKVLIDEGYSRTEYFYPVERYTIVELSIYEI